MTRDFACLGTAVSIGLLICGVGVAQGSRGPRTPDRRPDLSGIWRSVDDRYLTDLSAGRPRIVLQPSARASYDERRGDRGKVRPSQRCLPRGVPGMMLAPDEPWKIVQTPDTVVILFHESLHYRQIFTDGRRFPDNLEPTWLGYSIGRWDGDTLVAETTGLTEQTWLDERGHPHTDALRVIERFRRRTDRTMDLDITINDPKAYTRPWTVRAHFELVGPNADLGEHVCAVSPVEAAK